MQVNQQVWSVDEQQRFADAIKGKTQIAEIIQALRNSISEDSPSAAERQLQAILQGRKADPEKLKTILQKIDPDNVRNDLNEAKIFAGMPVEPVALTNLLTNPDFLCIKDERTMLNRVSSAMKQNKVGTVDEIDRIMNNDELPIEEKAMQLHEIMVANRVSPADATLLVRTPLARFEASMGYERVANLIDREGYNNYPSKQQARLIAENLIKTIDDIERYAVYAAQDISGMQDILNKAKQDLVQLQTDYNKDYLLAHSNYVDIQNHWNQLNVILGNCKTVLGERTIPFIDDQNMNVNIQEHVTDKTISLERKLQGQMQYEDYADVKGIQHVLRQLTDDVRRSENNVIETARRENVNPETLPAHLLFGDVRNQIEAVKNARNKETQRLYHNLIEDLHDNYNMSPETAEVLHGKVPSQEWDAQKAMKEYENLELAIINCHTLDVANHDAEYVKHNTEGTRITLLANALRDDINAAKTALGRLDPNNEIALEKGRVIVDIEKELLIANEPHNPDLDRKDALRKAIELAHTHCYMPNILHENVLAALTTGAAEYNIPELAADAPNVDLHKTEYDVLYGVHGHENSVHFGQPKIASVTDGAAIITARTTSIPFVTREADDRNNGPRPLISMNDVEKIARGAYGLHPDVLLPANWKDSVAIYANGDKISLPESQKQDVHIQEGQVEITVPVRNGERVDIIKEHNAEKHHARKNVNGLHAYNDRRNDIKKFRDVRKQIENTLVSAVQAKVNAQYVDGTRTKVTNKIFGEEQLPNRILKHQTWEGKTNWEKFTTPSQWHFNTNQEIDELTKRVYNQVKGESDLGTRNTAIQTQINNQIGNKPELVDTLYLEQLKLDSQDHHKMINDRLFALQKELNAKRHKSIVSKKGIDISEAEINYVKQSGEANYDNGQKTITFTYKKGNADFYKAEELERYVDVALSSTTLSDDEKRQYKEAWKSDITKVKFTDQEHTNEGGLGRQKRAVMHVRDVVGDNRFTDFFHSLRPSRDVEAPAGGVTYNQVKQGSHWEKVYKDTDLEKADTGKITITVPMTQAEKEAQMKEEEMKKAEPRVNLERVQHREEERSFPRRRENQPPNRVQIEINKRPSSVRSNRSV